MLPSARIVFEFPEANYRIQNQSCFLKTSTTEAFWTQVRIYWPTFALESSGKLHARDYFCIFGKRPHAPVAVFLSPICIGLVFPEEVSQTYVIVISLNMIHDACINSINRDPNPIWINKCQTSYFNNSNFSKVISSE